MFDCGGVSRAVGFGDGRELMHSSVISAQF